jgi:capsular polysaccharide transport system ATP-binding protein
MRSRLAFGMSMAFDFDYYLIDELMAVGDAQFRRKSQQAFQSRLANANVIVVSHSMADIRQWCDVIVLVKDGHATLYEDVEAGIVAYQGPSSPSVARNRRTSPPSAPPPPAAANEPIGPATGAPARTNQPSTVP